MFTNNNAYDWYRHKQHLLELGRGIDNQYTIRANSAEGISALLLQNLTALYDGYQAVILENDFDYSAPFLMVSFAERIPLDFYLHNISVCFGHEFACLQNCW